MKLTLPVSNGRVSARTAELSIQGSDMEASRPKQFVSHVNDRHSVLRFWTEWLVSGLSTTESSTVARQEGYLVCLWDVIHDIRRGFD